MSKLLEITHQELLEMLQDAFASGLCSYAELSDKVCGEIVSKFIENKSQSLKTSFGVTTSYTTNPNEIDWNSDQLLNMSTYLSNIISS